MSSDIEHRMRRLEKTLERFFDALATSETSPHANAAEQTGRDPSRTASVEERLRWLEKQTLRLQCHGVDTQRVRHAGSGQGHDTFSAVFVEGMSAEITVSENSRSWSASPVTSS